MGQGRVGATGVGVGGVMGIEGSVDDGTTEIERVTNERGRGSFGRARQLHR